MHTALPSPIPSSAYLPSYTVCIHEDGRNRWPLTDGLPPDFPRKRVLQTCCRRYRPHPLLPPLPPSYFQMSPPEREFLLFSVSRNPPCHRNDSFPFLSVLLMQQGMSPLLMRHPPRYYSLFSLPVRSEPFLLSEAFPEDPDGLAVLPAASSLFAASSFIWVVTSSCFKL